MRVSGSWVYVDASRLGCLEFLITFFSGCLATFNDLYLLKILFRYYIVSGTHRGFGVALSDSLAALELFSFESSIVVYLSIVTIFVPRKTKFCLRE